MVCTVKGYANITITRHIIQSTEKSKLLLRGHIAQSMLMRSWRKAEKDGPRKSLTLIFWKNENYSIKSITTLIENRKVIERKNGVKIIQNRFMSDMLNIIILIELKRLRENIDIY